MSVSSVVTKQMELVKGWEVSVEIKGDVQKYALAFLHIFNNVRENDGLVRVENAADSNVVSVVCYDAYLNATRKYLEQFGEIKGVSSALIVCNMEYIDYDFNTYDTIACDFQED